MELTDKLKDLFTTAFKLGVISYFPDAEQSSLELRADAEWLIHRAATKLEFEAEPAGEEIYIEPVTEYDVTTKSYTPATFMFEEYRNWEGKIIGPAKNGDMPAWRVRISPDRIRFVNTTINKEDVKPLFEKHIKESWQ